MPDNTTTVVRGDNTPLLQEVIYDFDPQRGWTAESFYEGASQAYMQLLAAQYSANGIACRLVYRKDAASIQAHDATQNYTLDVWQIVGNDEEVDLLTHPSVLNLCSDDQVAAIRFGISNINAAQPVSGQITNNILGNAIFNNLDAGSKAILAGFIGLYLRGTDHYRRSQYVLRHTTNCPNRWLGAAAAQWPANIALNNIENIYSTAKLLTEVTNVNSWIYPLPPEMVYTLQNLPGSPLSPVPANYAYGWLKSPSTTTTAANNRVDITSEYTLYLWSTLIYPYAG